MEKVKPKKHLGQHFLTDLSIAERIAQAVKGHDGVNKVLEIGPGMGVLTDFLLKNPQELYLIEIDRESIAYLHKKYPQLGERIIEGDYLKYDASRILPEKYSIAGNFPYNISSQIFFKVLEEKDRVTEVVCMLQKEVAMRIASPKGNKDYGILSVLLQAWYDIEYLFTVPPTVFNPPPKVNSGVIRLTRNSVQKLDCDEKLFFKVVKGGFSTRRKTLRNALKSFELSEEFRSSPILDKRAEQLGVEEFVFLTQQIEKGRGSN
ncbi:16S rRNA (adenine(1518)-N(6)/adenine(1519)-N(6))-dimethyltransferase RsmA [Algoriphagus sp.]|jgi:16S rRNA (adenine1518-N6/adenine1519-N6)-dimethyltransferase|uniref:16S rRNA (adenine(1518)-N(6)/adenine(1519)-N(6))- dimethyltransferase RsmA n=1 Tax=Algoriphagus sp. TaxID=1872435 RepID=UPI002716B73E|nr:16S rRNA (adenine(1518)-N(6)/adenine(1519)-N(6))-dimethyltransferase RsmA [Algoriphagus sp.]MDO8967669.1 16S rRNA (adenine(1518)-N(6)/adenine(1519)-N(6))-dimethyltransferase RsmA [Algoriphagus sp.]MDP3198365.1 16S rRNA (adenine(1518)-N(6)/adenine(1519)-N(6))-dimethyltransferase RsmA [Algoriphagus sp.]